ncbi:MAG: IPT/TIG domain-containing protein [Actinobacteria bacterium]|nr:IPT/TIG domain-containing protein [Actinomycetota bacterium]
MGASRLAVLLPALAVLSAAVCSAAAYATPPSSAIRYGYDAAGELKSVTDPSDMTALFGWDSVGNLLSIGNQPAGALSLIQVAPVQGSAGDRVTLYGTGFSSNATDDAVSFNGTAASVVSATAWELVVTVPAGATTGPVSVTTPSGSATSDESFTVVARPAITGISPTVVNAGDTVTVGGSAFDSAPANDTLIVNRTHVDVASASAAALSFVAPAIGSGPVSVATPDGQATGPDLFIAPSGRTAASVATTDRESRGRPHGEHPDGRQGRARGLRRQHRTAAADPNVAEHLRVGPARVRSESERLDARGGHDEQLRRPVHAADERHVHDHGRRLEHRSRQHLARAQERDRRDDDGDAVGDRRKR